MKEIPGTENQYSCHKGERVTIEFDPHGSTVFLVSRTFMAPSMPNPPKIENKHLTFQVTEDTTLFIIYTFTNTGSFYDVTLEGNGDGDRFVTRLQKPIGRTNDSQIYTFDVP